MDHDVSREGMMDTVRVLLKLCNKEKGGEQKLVSIG